MRGKIDALYSTHNPAKLPEVEHLIQKYGHAYLLTMMQRKYEGPTGGTSAPAPAATAVSSTSVSAPAAAAETTSGSSNKRISLVFFTRPCAETVVQCLPGCEDSDSDPSGQGEAEGEAGYRFAPILAADYRKVADDKRDALDGTGGAGSDEAQKTKPAD